MSRISAVELDDVGLHPHQLLEAGVAGAGVVDRDPRAALAQVGDRLLERVVVGHDLVLGDLDHDLVQVAAQGPLHDRGRERRRADVERQVGAEGATERLQRRADRHRLELGAEPAAVRQGEPDVRGAPAACPGSGRAPRSRRGARSRARRRAGRPGDRRVPGRAGASISRPLALGPGRGRALGSKRRVRRLPPRLAQYRAPSASWQRVDASSASAGKVAIPAEQLSSKPRTAIAATSPRARSATSKAASASVPGRISANSSPPTRAAMSSPRIASRSAEPTALRIVVAVGMAVGVVDRLEVVEVEDHQRDRAGELAAALELGPQGLVKAAVVGEPGERVGAGEAEQALVLALDQEQQGRR